MGFVAVQLDFLEPNKYINTNDVVKGLMKKFLSCGFFSKPKIVENSGVLKNSQLMRGK